MTMRGGPVVLYARTELRHRWLSLLGLVLLVAVAGAFVLTAATGARRVATAWTRFGSATRAPNLVATPLIDQLDDTAMQLRAQPGVEGVSALGWLPIRPKQLDDPQVGGFGAVLPGFGDGVYRALVLDGRRADQSRADEFTINPAMSRATGLHVGDRTTLVSIVPGVEIDAMVVGITKGPLDTGSNGDGPSMLFTYALVQRFFEPMKTFAGDAFQPALVARLDAGSDTDPIVARLSADLPGRTVATGDVFGGEAATALAVEERAYWILASAAGVAAVLALGQIMVRSLRHSSGDVDALSALGCSTAQRIVMLVAAPVAAVMIGMAVAFGLAYVASAAVPTGLASRIDPESGVWVDIRFAIAGAAVFMGALVVTLVLAAQRLATRRAAAAHDVAPPSRIAAASHTAPSLLGLRAALGGPDLASRRSARTATAILVVALASVIAVPVWVASLHNLRTTPRAHGWDFDAAVDDTVAPSEGTAAIDSLADKLEGSGATSAIERVDFATVTVGSAEIELMVIQPRQGSLHPTLREGRSPYGPGEIAVTNRLLKDRDAKIGDSITIDTSTGGHKLTVVGEAVFPAIHTADWGGAASVTADAVEALGLQITDSTLLIDIASGRSLDDVRSIVGSDGLVRAPSPPPVVDNLREAVPVIRVLAIFVALLGAATLAHALVTSSHRRRHDHATVRAMGLTGRQLMAAFGWHSATIALIAIVIAVPLGIATSAFAWRLSVRTLGVLDSFHIPPVTTIAIAVATLSVAVLGAFAIAINARRAPLAASLRTE
jgi:hypothetical protein